MEKLVLNAKPRSELKKGIKPLRRKDLIPGVVYGPNRKSTNIIIDKKEFEALYKIAEETKMIDFSIEGEKKTSKVIIREVQKPPLGGHPIHVSFFEVDEKKKINVDVLLEFSGESFAVRNNLGILITPIASLPIKCLPGNVPDKLIIDLGTLNDVGNAIKISDIKLPEGVEWESNLVLSNNVAYIVAPQKEIEVEEVAAPVEGEEAAEEGTEEKTEGTEGSKDEKKEEKQGKK